MDSRTRDRSALEIITGTSLIITGVFCHGMHQNVEIPTYNQELYASIATGVSVIGGGIATLGFYNIFKKNT